jgi:hypothetical protein
LLTRYVTPHYHTVRMDGWMDGWMDDDDMWR